MRASIDFEPYTGREPYIFLRYDALDKKAAADAITVLMDKQFRICYAEHDRTRVEDSEWVADRLLASRLVLFLISADSLKSLAYRNTINYALSKKRRIFCIYLDDQELDGGMAMQLSNVPSAHINDYTDIVDLCENMILTNEFVQDMRGDDAKIPIRRNRAKRVAITALAAVVALFVAGASFIAVYRFNYENSLAGQIEEVTEIDYLDISNEDPSIVELLKGKTVFTLVARDMNLTDIEAFRYVNCETLDLSGNPNINTLEPLLANERLQTVTVSQDMYPAIAKIAGHHEFRMIIDE